MQAMVFTMQPLPLIDGRYRSRETKTSLPARLFPSFCFYLRLTSLVFSTGFTARLGKFDSGHWVSSSLEVLRGMEAVGVKVEVEGLANLAKEQGPKVIIGNHMSMMETLVLPAVVRPYGPVTFVVKDSLLSYPIFKHVMNSRQPIAVTRTNPRQDLKTVLGEGMERLGRGISIIVFPQTTRTNLFDPQQMSSIGIKLAAKAGVPVVPLALMTNCWKNGQMLKDFGAINPAEPACFAFGEPMAINGKGVEEHQRVNEFITSKLDQWQAAKALAKED